MNTELVLPKKVIFEDSVCIDITQKFLVVFSVFPLSKNPITFKTNAYNRL